MTDIKTERVEWIDKSGKELGFNINFRGGCNIAISFEYICLTCSEHAIIQHKRSEPMSGRPCTKCSGELARYHDVPPMMDADYHDSQRTHNLGWDE